MIIDDPAMKYNLNQLKFNIVAYYILSQYGRAMDAFKQTVFHFAAECLDFYEFPSSLATDNDLNIITAITVDTINTDELNELNGTSINPLDGEIHDTFFKTILCLFAR